MPHPLTAISISGYDIENTTEEEKVSFEVPQDEILKEGTFTTSKPPNLKNVTSADSESVQSVTNQVPNIESTHLISSTVETTESGSLIENPGMDQKSFQEPSDQINSTTEDIKGNSGILGHVTSQGLQLH